MATTTNNAAAASSGAHCEKLRGQIQVAIDVRNDEISLTANGGLPRPIDVAANASANPNASTKAEDELHDDGCADDLYTPMMIDPRVKATLIEELQYLFDRLQLIVEEDRMTKDHANVYKAFLKVAVKNWWKKTADEYGFSSVTNITLFFDVHLGREREGMKKASYNHVLRDARMKVENGHPNCIYKHDPRQMLGVKESHQPFFQKMK
jgi:hypothetical protein